MYCYICRKELTPEDTHPFYQKLCTECGTFNWQKREELAPLQGYTALVTGGRIKIGYETALKLLRSGAFVVITTRFPADAATRYRQEPDFDGWSQRLRIFQVDFRQLSGITSLIRYLYEELPHLDILINNAAQTVRHEAAYYEGLCDAEAAHWDRLPEETRRLIAARSSQEEFLELQRSLDQFTVLRPRSLRSAELPALAEKQRLPSPASHRQQKNSWIYTAGDVPLVELYEVQQINSTTPYLLATGLRHLMKQSPHSFKYVINVSAMEGQFSKKNKNIFHPHTNMAKASLNMFTRTSAQDFLTSGILMNSVDTGWITDENPLWIQEKNKKRGLLPPLDAKDGASRLCDPIFSSVLRGEHSYGLFLKDYAPTEW